MPSRWSFKNGRLSLKFYARTPNDQWRFRRSWIFQKFLKHGQKGENLTNNASSKTRHGSDAFCRHVRSIANPELCYDSFFYLLVSGFGGDANLFKAVRYESALPFILTPTLSRGISLNIRKRDNKGGSMNHILNLDDTERELIKAELFERLYMILEDRDDHESGKLTETFLVPCECAGA